MRIGSSRIHLISLRYIFLQRIRLRIRQRSSIRKPLATDLIALIRLLHPSAGPLLIAEESQVGFYRVVSSASVAPSRLDQVGFALPRQTTSPRRCSQRPHRPPIRRIGTFPPDSRHITRARTNSKASVSLRFLTSRSTPAATQS